MYTYTRLNLIVNLNIFLHRNAHFLTEERVGAPYMSSVCIRTRTHIQIQLWIWIYSYIEMCTSGHRSVGTPYMSSVYMHIDSDREFDLGVHSDRVQEIRLRGVSYLNLYLHVYLTYAHLNPILFLNVYLNICLLTEEHGLALHQPSLHTGHELLVANNHCPSLQQSDVVPILVTHFCKRARF